MGPSVPAIAFASLIILATLFQLALAAGMPWGTLAMGGKYPGRLPVPMRFAAVIQALLLLLLATVVLVRAGMVLPGAFAASRTGIWVVVAIFAVSLVLNLITPSRWERRIWSPVAFALLACGALVAVS